MTCRGKEILRVAQNDESQDCFAFARNDVSTVANDKAQSTLTAFSRFTSHVSRKRAAFTLAEVLITLGIIGVVAAMTMPTLIQKQQDKVTVVKLKKAYNILSNAYLYYLKDNDPSYIEFTEDGAKTVFEMFKPYLNIAKDCGAGNDLTCGGMGAHVNSTYYKVILNDGIGLIFRGGSQGALDSSLDYDLHVDFEILVDLNGAKGPNQWGYDIFEFDALNGKIVPCGSPSIDGMPSFATHCAKKNSLNYACAAWVILNENVDYLYCEDLSWDGKTKCK